MAYNEELIQVQERGLVSPRCKCWYSHNLTQTHHSWIKSKLFWKR